MCALVDEGVKRHAKLYKTPQATGVIVQRTAATGRAVLSLVPDVTSKSRDRTSHTPAPRLGDTGKVKVHGLRLAHQADVPS